MTTFTKRSRVDAALRGEPVDRPPVSAWRHFIPEERSAAPLAEAHLRFFQTYDWDWLKVNPRATYYAEAWGARYDNDDYTGVLPRLIETPLRSAADLTRIGPRNPDTPALAEQIELVRRIKAGVGDAHLLQTVFSPLSVLAFLSAQPGDQSADLGLGSSFERLRALLRENPAAAHTALNTIAQSLARFAAANVAAGASGIFFAIVRLARLGVLTAREYAEFGRPYDLQVLEAVQGAPFNLLHICGVRVHFDQVLDYPVHALNWATLGQDNPSLAQARERTSKALVGGLDEHGTLQHGSPADVLAEAQGTLARAGRAGVLLAPGCGLALDVPEANLRALRQAVEPVVAV
jgi:uroporphyrinogen decarboxylase